MEKFSFEISFQTISQLQLVNAVVLFGPQNQMQATGVNILYYIVLQFIL